MPRGVKSLVSIVLKSALRENCTSYITAPGTVSHVTDFVVSIRVAPSAGEGRRGAAGGGSGETPSAVTIMITFSSGLSLDGSRGELTTESATFIPPITWPYAVYFPSR